MDIQAQERIDDVVPTLSQIRDNVLKVKASSVAGLAILGFRSKEEALAEIAEQIAGCITTLKEGW